MDFKFKLLRFNENKKVFRGAREQREPPQESEDDVRLVQKIISLYNDNVSTDR